MSTSQSLLLHAIECRANLYIIFLYENDDIQNDDDDDFNDPEDLIFEFLYTNQ